MLTTKKDVLSKIVVFLTCDLMDCNVDNLNSYLSFHLFVTRLSLSPDGLVGTAVT